MDLPELEKGQHLDLIFKNCRLPVEPGMEPVRGWILLSNGRIDDMGKGDPEGYRIPRDSGAIDLNGNLLLPGFYDSHMHLYQWSISRKAIDMTGARSPKEIIARLDRRLKDDEPDPFLEGSGILFGVDYDESIFGVKDDLDGPYLDRYFPDAPVILRRICGHRVILNRAAQDRFDPENIVDGILEEDAAMKITWEIPVERKSRIDSLQEAVMEMRKLGVLGGVDIIPASVLSNARDAYFSLEDSPMVSLSVHFQDDITTNGEIGDFKSWKDLDVGPGFYNQKEPRVIFSKYFVDGSIGARTASFTYAYLDHELEPPLLDDNEIRDCISDSTDKRLIPMFHAIGDAAVHSVLNSVDGHALRIEHAESINEKDLQKIKDPGLAICMQPNFQSRWGGKDALYMEAIGDRRLSLNNFNGVMRKNDLVCFGSDMMPPGPVYGMVGACSHSNPDSSISFGAAIDAYSRISAILSFPGSGIFGCLARGKDADLSIFQGNNTRSILTVIKGKVGSMGDI